jgi:voltage-gated potassium channel
MATYREIKALPRRIEISLSLIIALLLIGTLGFKFILDISFSQAFITTLESFALMYHAESGAAKAFGISITLFGVILLWWVLWSLFDMFSEGSIRKYLKVSKFLNKLNKMENHYIIAGGGRVGEEIADHLKASGKNYIVIEKDELIINKLRKKDHFVMHGDVTDEAVLNKARVKSAKAAILAMPETEKNLLVTMMIKELNPDIDIHTRADKPAFVSKLKKAGAKTVVVPELVAAEHLLEAIK